MPMLTSISPRVAQAGGRTALLMRCSLGAVAAVGVLAVALASLTASRAPAAETDPAVERWRSATVRPVATLADRHVIHAYFNTSPESPDGRYVLYYTSGTRAGEQGDLRIQERATGKETILAHDITTEDAHRAACQQWSNGGKTVVYHDCRQGRWMVIAVDVATRKERVLAEDRQLGFGSPTGAWAPVYGCHWNPGRHRDLELVNVVTGEIRPLVTAEEVVRKYGDWIQTRFGTTNISLFFPVVSPDGRRVFFKLAHPSGGTDFRSKAASDRDGKVVYDLEQGRFLHFLEKWGHPSWSPDGEGIFEHGKILFHVTTAKNTRHAPSCISNHPSIAPDGRVFVTDADVTKRPFGKPNHWAVAVGSMTVDDFAVIQVFDNTQGATSWRHNHPHPAFSADSNRIYYNVNDGPWARLMVAEAK